MLTNLSPASDMEYSGLSTDVKPVNVVNGAKFYEIDTSITYMYDATTFTWHPWSEVKSESEVLTIEHIVEQVAENMVANIKLHNVYQLLAENETANVTSYIDTVTLTNLITKVYNDQAPIIIVDGVRTTIIESTSSTLTLQLDQVYYDGNDAVIDFIVFDLYVSNNQSTLRMDTNRETILDVPYAVVIDAESTYSTGAKQFTINRTLQQIESMVAQGVMVILNYDGKTFIYGDAPQAGFHHITMGTNATIVIGDDNLADVMIDDCYLFATQNATENKIVQTKFTLG